MNSLNRHESDLLCYIVEKGEILGHLLQVEWADRPIFNTAGQTELYSGRHLSKSVTVPEG